MEAGSWIRRRAVLVDRFKSERRCYDVDGRSCWSTFLPETIVFVTANVFCNSS
jgi:hypothetical protein